MNSDSYISKNFLKKNSKNRKFMDVIIEEEVQVEVEVEGINNWDDDTEKLLRTWSDESKIISNSHRWKRKVCKYIHLIILLVTMISSYIFGSSGIIVIEQENDQMYIFTYFSFPSM